MRGIAAAVVALQHLTLIAGPVLETIPGATDPWSLWWIFEQSTLRLLSAGREAVLVFFVLSGLVVPLPALRSASFSWFGFAASRFVRLYLPAWVALAFAAGLVLAVPHLAEQVTGGVWIGEKTADTVEWKRLLAEFTLTTGGSQYDNVLWTLRWELTFSFVLPLLILLVALVGRWWPAAAAMSVALCMLGVIADVSTLAYLPVFFLGMLLGAHLDTISTWSDHVPRRRSRLVWSVALLASSVVLAGSWLLEPVVRDGTWGNHALIGLESAGAAGIVAAAVGCRPWRALLERRAPQFLGRISFSLYLVHVPVLVALTYLVGDWNWWLVGLIGIPVSVALAWVFFRFVERPTHGLARRAGRGAAAAVDRYRERLGVRSA